MFHAFDFNFRWIPGGLEKVDVLMLNDVENVTVSEDCGGFSGSVFQSGENGDHSCIFGSGQGTFSEEIVRNITKRVQESGVDSVAAEFIYTARKKISGVNEGDNACGDDMLSICQSAATVKGKNNRSKRHFVSFSDEIVVYSIPDEDRKSP